MLQCDLGWAFESYPRFQHRVVTDSSSQFAGICVSDEIGWIKTEGLVADEGDHQAFFALKKGDEENAWTHFSYGFEVEELKKWGATISDEDEAQEKSTIGSSADDENPLDEIMNRIVDTGFALEELSISSGMVKEVFPSLVSKFEVVEPIKKSCPVVYDDSELVVYGISSDRMTKIREQHRRLLRMERGFSLLPSAVLLTFVSTFDSLISEIVRGMLKLKPERFESSDKSLAVSDILRMGSFEELRAKLLDDEVYLFSRGSHEEQVKYIEKWFHVKIADNWKRWPDFIEIFERRNLIAHGEPKFTERYVNTCKNNGHKGSEKLLGAKIELTKNYLSQSLEVLLEFGILLSFSIWRKQFSEEESKAFDSVNHVCYRLISDDSHRVPIRVIEFVLSLKGVKIVESTRLMLIVNLASAYKHVKEDDKSKDILDKVDWSAVADQFKICVASVRGDVDEVVKLMGSMSNANGIKKDDFREWPVFSFVRDTKEFQLRFEELYGESFVDPSTESTKIDHVKVEAEQIQTDPPTNDQSIH